jgi:hypothetical protein
MLKSFRDKNLLEYGGNMKTLISVYLFFVTFCAALSFMAAPLSASTVSGLSSIGTAQVPCYVTIVEGGELRVSIDIDRKADLEITNRAGGQSVVTVLEYRNGKPRKGFNAESSTLDRDEYRKEWRFNRFFEQTPESSVVDEVRIQVQKGAVSAKMGQTGDNRQDFYNDGYQHGTFVNSGKPLTLRITGDDPSNNQTSGKFWLEYETGNYSEKTSFTIEGGKTLTWSYPAGEGIKGLEVEISKGRAKISLIQGPDSKEPVHKPTAPKNASKPSPQPKDMASPKPEAKKQMAALPTVQAATSSGSILDGEVPLYKGSRVLKSKSTGAYAKAQLEADASPQDIVDFYKNAMSGKGWVPGMAMVQGNKGVLMFKQSNRQLVFKVKGQGDTSKIDVTLINQ